MFYIALIRRLMLCKQFVNLNSYQLNKVYCKSINFEQEKQKII